MQFKHSLSIFAANLSLSYKVLLLIFFVFFIASALFVSIFNPLFDGLREALEIGSVPFSLTSFVQDPVKTVADIWHTATDFLSRNTRLIASRFVYLSLLVLFMRFFSSLAVVPVTRILRDKMTSGYAGGILPTMVALLPQTLLYALVSSVIYVLIDLSIAALALLLLFQLYKVFKFTSFFVAISIGIAAYTARISLFSQWAPIIADGEKNVFKALAASFRPSIKSFSAHYPIALTLNLVYFAVIAITALPTFAVLPVFTIPMYIVLLCIASLTNYFHFVGRKYYIDDGITAYVPKKK